MNSYKRFAFLFSIIFILGLAATQTAHAALGAYLKIDDIPGECQRKGYEGWIELAGFNYPVIRSAATQQVGRGRARARAEVGPVLFEKWGDSASVYINLATLQGRSFEQMVVDIVRPDGSLQFRYTFENVSFVQYESSVADGDDRVDESASITFERLTVLYIEQNRDGSAGDEHEITYDIAAGV